MKHPSDLAGVILVLEVCNQLMGQIQLNSVSLWTVIVTCVILALYWSPSLLVNVMIFVYSLAMYCHWYMAVTVDKTPNLLTPDVSGFSVVVIVM